MQIVNGYVCRTCCDVDAAKAGKDPAHPNAPPGSTDKPGQSNKSGQTTNADPTVGVQSGAAGRPAVTFGGALAQLNGAPASGQPTAPSPPAAPAYSGALVDLSA